MKYKAIIFDLSDTLIEYTPNFSQIYSERVGSLGFDITEEMAKELSKLINWKISEQVLKEQLHNERRITENELNELLDKTALEYVTNNKFDSDMLLRLVKIPLPKQEMKLISNVFEVLDFLKGKYRLAIVSNHYKWMKAYLNDLGISQYFDSIIISEIVGVAKPHIGIMEIALNELKLDAKDCLYVGDQPIDVLCSKQIGMDCAWISNNVELPDYIQFNEDYKISSVNELVNIL